MLRHIRNYRLSDAFVNHKTFLLQPIVGRKYVNDIQKSCFSMVSLESIAKTQTGIFKSISESTPVEYCQKFLVAVHDTSGLPWWASIICTTFLLRGCITAPLSLYQHYIMAKLECIKIEMDGIAKELTKETSVAVKMYKWDEKTARIAYKVSIRNQWNKLIVRENCHPFKTTLLIFFQIPLWISLSVSLRNLIYMLPNQDVQAHYIFTQLSVGGFGWIPNLTEVDHSLILPVVFGFLNLAIIELQTMSRTQPTSKLQKYLTNFFRGVTLLMIPVSSFVPSGVVLYWTSSSAFGLVQNLCLLSPKLRRACRIPKTATEHEHPYQNVVSNLKMRLKSLPGVSRFSQ